MSGVLFGLFLSRAKEIYNVPRFCRVGIINDRVPWLNHSKTFRVLTRDLKSDDVTSDNTSHVSRFRKKSCNNFTCRFNDERAISVLIPNDAPIKSNQLNGLTNRTKWKSQNSCRITTRLFQEILRNPVTQLINKKTFRTLTFTRDFHLKNSRQKTTFSRRLISNNSVFRTTNKRVLMRTVGRCNWLQIRGKSYARFLDYSKVPKLIDSDLEEQFVKGSGPGGQSVNKTNNAVCLKHKPTGLIVKCHETRSLAENRKRAREILVTKLDNMLNGENSLENQEKLLKKKDLAKKQLKKKKLAEMKKAFKERENLA